MKKKIKPLGDWERRWLTNRIKDIQEDIEGITSSYRLAKGEWEREIRKYQEMLDGKEEFHLPYSINY